jgi:hypothetical protein
LPDGTIISFNNHLLCFYDDGSLWQEYGNHKGWVTKEAKKIMTMIADKYVDFKCLSPRTEDGVEIYGHQK